MSNAPPDLERPVVSRGFRLLERVTEVVLWLVVAALGWMLVVTYRPGWVRLASVEAEVVAVLALLTVALLLVGVVALLHTRS